MGATMERISVNGIELEFDWAGSGEAVVFIHGVGVADSFLPLAVEPALRDHYRVIRYLSLRFLSPVIIGARAGDLGVCYKRFQARRETGVAPDLADGVVTGMVPLDKAYESTDALMANLRRDATPTAARAIVICGRSQRGFAARPGFRGRGVPSLRAC